MLGIPAINIQPYSSTSTNTAGIISTSRFARLLTSVRNTIEGFSKSPSSSSLTSMTISETSTTSTDSSESHGPDLYEDGKPNYDTHSLILSGLGQRLAMLDSTPTRQLNTLASSCLVLSKKSYANNTLNGTVERYRDLRDLKRALVHAERKGDLPPFVLSHLQLMVETIRILQVQTRAIWVNTAIMQAQQESRQVGPGRAGNMELASRTTGLSVGADIGIGKIRFSFGLVKKKVQRHNDDATIGTRKENIKKIGVSLKGRIVAAHGKVGLEGSHHRISYKEYRNEVDAATGLKIKQIKADLHALMPRSLRKSLSGFSGDLWVDSLQKTANHSAPRLAHLVRVLGLSNELSEIKVSQLTPVEVPPLFYLQGRKLQGQLTGEATVDAGLNVRLAGDYSRTWLSGSRYQSFLSAQKMDASTLTPTQLQEHQQQLHKINALIDALPSKEKLVLDSDSEDKALFAAQRQLLYEVQEYGSLCSELDLAIHLKQYQRSQTLTNVKQRMEAKWHIHGTEDGRYKYLQKTLLAFCYLDRQWQDMTLTESYLYETAQKLAAEMAQFIVHPPMHVNKEKLHKATCFTIEVPFTHTTAAGSVAANFGVNLGSGGYVQGQGNVRGGGAIEYITQIHPSRMRDGRYLDITLSLGADAASVISARLKNVLSGAGLKGETLDSAVSELEKLAEKRLQLGITGKVQLRFFAPSERYAPMLDANETQPYRLLYIRCFGELALKRTVKNDIPIPVNPTLFIGVESEFDMSGSKVLFEHIGTNTFCYLATQHHGKMSGDVNYLPDWNRFLNRYSNQLGKLFSNLADPESLVSQEARFMLQQQSTKTGVDEVDKNQEETFFAAMLGFRDCVESGKKSDETFNLARAQLTALFEHDQSHWTEEKKTTWIYRS